MRRNHAIALFTTAAKMTPQQLVYTANRKVKSGVYPNIPLSLDDYYSDKDNTINIDFSLIAQSTNTIRSSLTARDKDYLHQQVVSLERGEVKFLNRSVEIDGEPPFLINPLVGEEQGFPRLWTLKLLSLEPASWIALTGSENDTMAVRMMVRWLESWLTQDVTSIGSQDCLRRYWTPYAVTRRIGNLAMLGGILTSQRETNCEMLSEHFAKNVRFLSDHIEYDIGGNHLLENACGLIIGGVLLDDDNVVSSGVSILRSELSNQLLGDGMHFERSPMYHTILLYRIAWCLDILRRSGRTFSSDIVSYIGSMYWCLQRIAPGNANYPLLNDSVFREAPSRRSCLSVVENLFEIDDDTHRNDTSGESGYYTIVSGELMCIVDGGMHSPKHLPAHAHNDLGNVVLWAGETPVITDTGTFDYEPGDRREYARSVEAHNTVQVDDSDQSVTHGRFLMGPRPKPETTYFDSDSKRGVVLRYQSPRFVHSYTHERLVEPVVDGIQINDRVVATNSTVTSRLHLSPKAESRLDGDTVEVKLRNGSTVEITAIGADSIGVIETEYYPEYGVVTDQSTIEASITTEDSVGCIEFEIIHEVKQK